MLAHEIAAFMHVSEAQVQRWLAQGLPQLMDGRIDPFVCANWLCWGHLSECPALLRRWRTYLIFFAPFLSGETAPRTVRCTMKRRIYLPQPSDQVYIVLPLLSASAQQELLSETHIIANGWQNGEIRADWWRAQQKIPASDDSTVHITQDVRVTPTVTDLSAAEKKLFLHWMSEVAGQFRYEYRHHSPDDYRANLCVEKTTEKITPRFEGSCFDCALALAAIAQQHQRPWRIMSGIVAHSAIANPHFWVECATTNGQWIPLDPSLPAIVRMMNGDWQTSVTAWTGNLDARRVTLGVVGAGAADIIGGASIGSRIGELFSPTYNAWSCLDWVCGDCETEFTQLS
jgi:Transglutaminase-like superfamily